MFGMGLPGVSLSIASIDAVRLLRDLVGECPAACPAACPFARLPLVGDSELILEIGSVACHSPSLLATPRQISGRRRSAGEHTLPSINL